MLAKAIEGFIVGGVKNHLPSQSLALLLADLGKVYAYLPVGHAILPEAFAFSCFAQNDFAFCVGEGHSSAALVNYCLKA